MFQILIVLFSLFCTSGWREEVIRDHRNRDCSVGKGQRNFRKGGRAEDRLNDPKAGWRNDKSYFMHQAPVVDNGGDHEIEFNSESLPELEYVTGRAARYTTVSPTW